MKAILAYLRRLLRSPSSYTAQPWAYARNQIGHGAVGALFVSLWGWQVIPGAMLAYAVWEFIQWKRYDAEAYDGFEDAANVMQWAMAAACVPYSVGLAGGVLAASLLGLASGILRRRMEAADAFGC